MGEFRWLDGSRYEGGYRGTEGAGRGKWLLGMGTNVLGWVLKIRHAGKGSSCG
jgi:hypothetical protein